MKKRTVDNRNRPAQPEPDQDPATEKPPAIREQGRRNLAEHFRYIERLLADGRGWAVPAGYSIVDPYLLVFFRWGERVGIDMRRDCPAWSAAILRSSPV